MDYANGINDLVKNAVLPLSAYWYDFKAGILCITGSGWVGFIYHPGYYRLQLMKEEPGEVIAWLNEGQWVQAETVEEAIEKLGGVNPPPVRNDDEFKNRRPGTRWPKETGEKTLRFFSTTLDDGATIWVDDCGVQYPVATLIYDEGRYRVYFDDLNEEETYRLLKSKSFDTALYEAIAVVQREATLSHK